MRRLLPFSLFGPLLPNPSTTLLVVASALAGAVAGLLLLPDETQLERPVLTVSGTHLGDVWQRNELSRVVTFRNRGSGRLNIEKVVASCSCTNVQPTRFTVDPGESQDVMVAVDLFKARVSKDGVVSVELLVVFVEDGINAPKRLTRSWTLTANVKAVATVAPAALLVKRGERDVDAIRVTPTARMAELIATCDSPSASAEVQKRDGEWLVGISVGQDMPPHATHFNVELQAILASGEAIPLRPYKVRVRPRIVAYPPSLEFQDAVGTGLTEKTVVLQSPEGEAFRIARVPNPQCLDINIPTHALANHHRITVTPSHSSAAYMPRELLRFGIETESGEAFDFAVLVRRTIASPRQLSNR